MYDVYIYVYISLYSTLLLESTYFSAKKPYVSAKVILIKKSDYCLAIRRPFTI